MSEAERKLIVALAEWVIAAPVAYVPKLTRDVIIALDKLRREEANPPEAR